MNHPAQNSNNTSKSEDLKLGTQEKEEDFYRELDKKSLHSSCCTCQTLAIFFVGVLLILSGTIFFLYWQISHGEGLRFNVAQMATVKDFQDKLTGVSPDATGSYQLVLSADELNTVLNEGLSVSDFLIKDMMISINPSEILIYGNLIQPIDSKIVMTTVPKAENGKIVLEVKKIIAGSLTLPDYFNQQATTALNDLMDKKMTNLYQKATVKSVDLSQSEIIIKGKIKTKK